VFSLLRSGEILIGASMAPLVGPLVDRYGGRWLMAGGALVAGLGFVLLSQVSAFWQFLLLRWLLVTIGGVFMCHMVVSVTISRWFVRKRGRAIAIASLGQGLSKVLIPIVTASLFVWLGWRWTWSIFGIITLVLVVIPALLFMQRSPEDMGLTPDGSDEVPKVHAAPISRSAAQRQEELKADIVWSWKEVLRTQTFWIICFIYGMANVGIAGLNLHVFAYVTDIGFEPIVAATVMSIIAMAQLGSTLLWGVIGERIEVRKSSMIMFVIQAAGLATVTATHQLAPVYVGFCLYGIGLGGSWVLQELIWATYYGRVSLGMVRGLGILVTHAVGAAGAPFFGFIYDVTGSYQSSFIMFVIALIAAALLGLFVRPPEKAAVVV
jgi:MFS family permease